MFFNWIAHLVCKNGKKQPLKKIFSQTKLIFSHQLTEKLVVSFSVNKFYKKLTKEIKVQAANFFSTKTEIGTSSTPFIFFGRQWNELVFLCLCSHATKRLSPTNFVWGFGSFGGHSWPILTSARWSFSFLSKGPHERFSETSPFCLGSKALTECSTWRRVLSQETKDKGKEQCRDMLTFPQLFPMLTKNKKEHIIVLEKYPQGRFLTWSEKYTSEKLSCGAWIVLFHALLYQWPKCSFVVKQ